MQNTIGGKRKFIGLEVRLLASILGIVLITIFVSGMSIIRMAEKILVDANREKILNSSIVVANSMAEQINRAKTDVRFTLTIPSVALTLDPDATYTFQDRAGFINAVNGLLGKLASIGGYYETFYVVDNTGMTITCSMPSAVGVLDISNRDWFHAAMQSGETIFSDPFRSRITGDALMAVAQRFTTNGHTGLMVGSLQIHKLTRAVFQKENTDWMQSVIVSKNGMTVASIDESAINVFSFADETWFRQVAGNASGFIEADKNGKPQLISFYQLPGTDLYALTIADKAHLIEPVRDITILGLLIVAVGTLLSCYVIYRIVTPVTTDIYKLAEYAKMVGQGDFTSSLDVKRDDEVGELVDSLKRMVVNLQQMISEAQAGTKAKSEFLARMSHEIRTPMNAVLGMAYIALQAGPEPKQKNYLLKIQSAAQGLLGIINDILDFSKIEAGKMVLESSAFSLSGMLESVYSLFEQRVEEKKLRFTIHISPDIPDGLVGDSLRLAQVCTNLCGNAIKFTESGEVSLHVELQELREENLLLHFSIRDTGIGMDEKRLHDIFDAFAQADGSTTRRFGGTGLGLAICKQLVKLMHGEIWAESAPGAGSTFHFTVLLGQHHQELPCGPSTDVPSSTAASSFPEARVLLVEDNEINQEIAVEFLKDFGITPLIANNGAEALAICKERSFDLVLMDIQMPVMDGLEATRQIRKCNAPGTATMPIIAMTANAMSGDREKSLLAGMNDHITKPLDHAELRQTLSRWLRPVAGKPASVCVE